MMKLIPERSIERLAAVPPIDEKPSMQGILQWLWFFIKPHKAEFFFHTFLQFLRRVLIYLVPLFIGKMIEGIEAGYLQTDPMKVWQWLFIMIVVSLISLSMILLGPYMMDFSEKISRKLSLYSLGHIMGLPLSWHEAEGAGSKIQRIMTARANILEMCNTFVFQVVTLFASATAAMVMTFFLDVPWFFVLVFLGYIGSYLYTAYRLSLPFPEYYDKHNRIYEKLMARVYEFISAIQTVKNFNLSKLVMRRGKDLELEDFEAMHGIHMRVFMFWFILCVLALVWISTIMGLSLVSISHGWMSIGAMASIVFITDSIWANMENVSYALRMFLEQHNGVMRLMNTLSIEPEKVDYMPLKPMPKKWKELHFDNVSFQYGKSEAALKGLNLSIKNGEKVALIGRSGAGKSTLVKVLMKQFLVTDGQIRFDKTDIKNIPVEKVLSEVSLVPQDVELFNISIEENILLDSPASMKKNLKSIIKGAYATEFINQLPEKEQTVIGERGIKLSGGQRQRIGIARALARKAEIVIFDEATSALDSESEMMIQEAMQQSFKDKTLVIIAHRLSTIRHVDRIFVLDDGKLVEEGSFEALIKKKGVFAKLWAMQSDGFLPE